MKLMQLLTLTKDRYGWRHAPTGRHYTLLASGDKVAFARVKFGTAVSLAGNKTIFRYGQIIAHTDGMITIAPSTQKVVGIDNGFWLKAVNIPCREATP